MLQPVGSLPPAIYWRRRVVVGGAVLALVVLTCYVLFGGGGKSDGKPAAGRSSLRSSSPAAQLTSSSSSRSTATRPAGARCALSSLAIAAATGARSYTVGAQASLLLVVTNRGKAPCVQDLADAQVELTVYTGDVRVWGSHDCQVQSGTSMQRLVPKKPVRLEVVWSGKTSQPGCGGTRLQVQPGTYRLYAALAGRRSAPVTFTVKA
jgi:hypothetical protein